MNIYFIVASLLPNADIIRLNAEVAHLNTDNAHLNAEVARLNTDNAHLNVEVAHLNTDNARLNDNTVQLNALVDKQNYDIETISMFVWLGHDNHPLDDISINLRNARHQSLWDRDIES